jgi:hypothetical protein
MYTVGLDVDKLVFTIKILLYAGNFYISGPLIFIMLGKIYLKQYTNKINLILIEQSAGNFKFSTKTTVCTKNTYNNYKNLSLISIHVNKHESNLNDNDFGYFLAGLIEGDG